jgi:hypothetical protein
MMMTRSDVHPSKKTAAVKRHTASKCIHTGMLPFTARGGNKKKLRPENSGLDNVLT